MSGALVCPAVVVDAAGEGLAWAGMFVAAAVAVEAVVAALVDAAGEGLAWAGMFVAAVLAGAPVTGAPASALFWLVIMVLSSLGGGSVAATLDSVV